MLDAVLRYHDATKHHFHRFARSLGYLDWASQPNPFRSFDGARTFPLWPGPGALTADYDPRPIPYDDLFDAGVPAPAPFGAPPLGDVLRHALGLSAWKVFRESRWSLRVNPSSGNLHPTEAYVVSGAAEGLADTPAVYHYAADRHALELRCQFDERAWRDACEGTPGIVLIVLTSIHWRESWKYGERAFRYCQHDLGHAMAALSLASRLAGWQTHALPAWSHAAMGALAGIDRDEDFVDAEREEPGCVLAIAPPGEVPSQIRNADARLLDAVKAGQWTGRANQLSEDHVQWTFIDDVARETRWTERLRPCEHEDKEIRGRASASVRAGGGAPARVMKGWGPTSRKKDELREAEGGRRGDHHARSLILQRRSAVAFDGLTRVSRATFLSILFRAMPNHGAPWDATWWVPRVHLLLFVHRVDDLQPGLYVLVRDASSLDALRAACGRDFLWTREDDELPLYCLARGDCTHLAARLSCDQAIASDGCFSLGMIADFERSLAEHGAPFYRNLFWETGVIGQVLYLEAEAAGIRATGIGCFYDDPVHDVLGLQGHAFQSLYHFTMGGPVEDTRLTTEPGYQWERP